MLLSPTNNHVKTRKKGTTSQQVAGLSFATVTLANTSGTLTTLPVQFTTAELANSCLKKQNHFGQ